MASSSKGFEPADELVSGLLQIARDCSQARGGRRDDARQFSVSPATCAMASILLDICVAPSAVSRAAVSISPTAQRWLSTEARISLAALSSRPTVAPIEFYASVASSAPPRMAGDAHGGGDVQDRRPGVDATPGILRTVANVTADLSAAAIVSRGEAKVESPAVAPTETA